MAGKTTRVLVDRKLADEAMGALGAKSRAEAARIAVKQLLDLSAEIGGQLRKRGASEEEVLADFAAWRQAKRAAARKSERQAGKKRRRATGREVERYTTAELLKRLGVESKD
jgi:LmbE family N-acetylglucosaminyl deacetylase